MANDIDKKSLNGELLPDELQDVAAGRLLTSDEFFGYFDVDTWVQEKCRDLRKNFRMAEALELSTALNEAFGAWRDYVGTLPEGSAEVEFSTYFRTRYEDLLSKYKFNM